MNCALVVVNVEGIAAGVGQEKSRWFVSEGVDTNGIEGCCRVED